MEGASADGRGRRTKLELRWPHKQGRLLYDYDDSGRPHPRFVELCPVEPRVLLDVAQFGSEEGKEWDAESNLLIRGDNLIALKTLHEYYASKVKLIYIDPPFNTQQAFREYEDGLEHSLWLTMMRDRLELLRALLAPDGSLWCEIDDSEAGYLNVLLDEIFGRVNRIATVTIKRSAATGHKAINPGPINVTDFLFGYARDASRWTYRPQLVLREAYDKQYSKWIPNIDAPEGEWTFEPLADVFARAKGFTDARAARRTMGAAPFKKAMEAFALENARQVVRFAMPNYEGVGRAARELIDRSRAERNTVFRLEREKHSDMLFYNGDRILFLSDKVHSPEVEEGVEGRGDLEAAEAEEVITEGEAGEIAEAEAGTSANGQGPAIAEKLTNFWDDIPWQGIAKEGGVDFPKNKKPERLLQRVIALATNKGDLVLDSFAGSGTTGAVAHKMGRRWIMVELGEHAETLALERLKRVVSGQDTTGVSKIEAWTGGGGFRYMTLGEPLLTREPELGLLVLNSSYSNGLLTTAVLLREGFRPTGDGVLHGQGGERAYAHVTEEFVTSDYLERVHGALPELASVVVYCLSHDSDLRHLEGVTVRRLPGDLAKRYCNGTPLFEVAGETEDANIEPALSSNGREAAGEGSSAKEREVRETPA